MVVTVNLKGEQVKTLDRIAQERGVSRSAVLRWAAEHYLNAFFSPKCHTDVTDETSNDQPAADTNA